LKFAGHLEFVLWLKSVRRKELGDGQWKTKKENGENGRNHQRRADFSGKEARVALNTSNPPNTN
jgi:hypothetical protein